MLIPTTIKVCLETLLETHTLQGTIDLATTSTADFATFIKANTTLRIEFLKWEVRGGKIYINEFKLHHLDEEVLITAVID